MEMIRNLRPLEKPDVSLFFRRDVKSKISKNIQTGKFTRNCVLSGLSTPNTQYPLFVKTPGLINPISVTMDNEYGYLEASEGTANNVLSATDELSVTNYWLCTTEEGYVTYCHPNIPTRIRAYRFITEKGYTPTVWRIEGSNDNVSWNVLHRVVASSWTWNDGKNVVQYDIPLENRGEYKYHRLVIEQLGGEVRIYSLQFFDSLCPTSTSVTVYADNENPLQLAFANGYNADGTPNDVLVSLTQPQTVDILDLILPGDLESSPLHYILYAKYNSYTGGIDFTCYTPVYEVLFNDITKNIPMKIENGKVYELDKMNNEWNQVFKLPLGLLSIYKTSDAVDKWLLYSFIPTFTPQMAIMPWHLYSFIPLLFTPQMTIMPICRPV